MKKSVGMFGVGVANGGGKATRGGRSSRRSAPPESTEDSLAEEEEEDVAGMHYPGLSVSSGYYQHLLDFVFHAMNILF